MLRVQNFDTVAYDIFGYDYTTEIEKVLGDVNELKADAHIFRSSLLLLSSTRLYFEKKEDYTSRGGNSWLASIWKKGGSNWGAATAICDEDLNAALYQCCWELSTNRVCNVRSATCLVRVIVNAERCAVPPKSSFLWSGTETVKKLSRCHPWWKNALNHIQGALHKDYNLAGCP